ncbi:anti-sigma factor [Demequina activiva]|uniref:Anti-sigma K factor RskA C-terminal domain-containing protein n=1 Tax=Demequina activiva TaxID=1582364 RepID=A0A919Q279_9MICO|nr:anti-sigma factor [Demequina activiva]GIG54930.1 hypothetical protein Dac01nite_16820 [Demequina activiva]
MSHLDEEALAALALGDGRPDDSSHVGACAQCRSELDAFEAAALRVGAASGAGPLLTPPDRVWDAIRADVAAPRAAQPVEPIHAVQASEQRERARASAVEDDLAPRRRRAPAWAMVAAAVGGAVLGAAAVIGGLTLATADAGATVVAEAPLQDLSTETDAGTAVLETREDGTEVLVVDTDFVEPDDAYLEVWLIDESIEGMVSLGHLTGERTEFVLPAGFDASAFPIVDISVEPLDGVPTHSGDSVTRGVLTV